MKTNALSTFYEQCHKFNKIAGKLENLKPSDIHNQLLLIKEELTEGFDAYYKSDNEGILDAAADLAVTVAGLGFILKELGFKTEEALIATAENNLSKFIDGKETTRADASVKALAEQGVTTYLSYNPQYNVFVIKDENNKIRKPVGFISNSLIRFVPKEVV